ncbi:acetyltransferase [Paenibacillus sp. NPDC056579]|uniref:acetyltransferase n=1 Tax=Paenibacillus sp. NPDC056579 TaxID=3345871 RepID=UPI0036CA818D
MLDIIIVGAGGFGREVYLWAKDAFPENEYRIKGFLSPNPHDLDYFRTEAKIIGDENTYDIQENDRFLFAIGNIDIKKRVVTQLKQRGAQFLTLIHPTAIVTPTATIGEGVILCPFVTVSDHVEIGNFVMMNFYSSCGHDAKVGDYSILCPYATVNGFSILQDEVFLASHSTVTPRKKVGYRAQVSANSVVMYDVPDYNFVFGVPGRNKRIF